MTNLYDSRNLPKKANLKTLDQNSYSRRVKFVTKGLCPLYDLIKYALCITLFHYIFSEDSAGLSGGESPLD